MLTLVYTLARKRWQVLYRFGCCPYKAADLIPRADRTTLGDPTTHHSERVRNPAHFALASNSLQLYYKACLFSAGVWMVGAASSAGRAEQC